METENNINVDLSKLNDEDLKKAKSILNIIDKRKKEY
jgi:hypothetical protein